MSAVRRTPSLMVMRTSDSVDTSYVAARGCHLAAGRAAAGRAASSSATTATSGTRRRTAKLLMGAGSGVDVEFNVRRRVTSRSRRYQRDFPDVRVLLKSPRLPRLDPGVPGRVRAAVRGVLQIGEGRP